MSDMMLQDRLRERITSRAEPDATHVVVAIADLEETIAALQRSAARDGLVAEGVARDHAAGRVAPSGAGEGVAAAGVIGRDGRRPRRQPRSGADAMTDPFPTPRGALSPDGVTAAVQAEPEPQPVVDDETFMENVREALSNGYDRLCAHCGIGTAGDDMDIHERRCREFDERQLR